MKNAKTDRCPGCGKHCPLSAPRCKYGRAYAAKMEAAAAKNCPLKKECKHKWEAHVTQGEALWQLLTLSRRLKKALCHGKTSEAELLAALSAPQREQLSQALKALGETLERRNEKSG